MTLSSLALTNAAAEPLWSDLNLNTEPGEFLVILGPNGVSKSTLLTTALGMRQLTHGSVKVGGNLGYIPQQRMLGPSLPIRVHDLVELAAGKNCSATEKMLEFVGASDVADRHVGTPSDGRQQLVRQAQAFVSTPGFLLCDKPLFSLDPAAQQTTVERLDRHRRENDTIVVLITHGINPILGVCDRVLYLTPYGHTVRSAEEIITSETLSELYQAEIMVARVEEELVIA